MKKFLCWFMTLLLSAGAVFAAGDPVDNTRTPPPPLEEARMPPPPPPLNEAVPGDREAGGTKDTAPAPKTPSAAPSAAAPSAAAAPAPAKTPSAVPAPSKPAAAAEAPSKPAAPEKPPVPADQNRAARLNSIGLSLGTTFAAPLILATPRITIAPVRYMFIELGFDIGGLTGIDRPDYIEDVNYFSMYPYAHLAYFRPFARKGGWYAGVGAGYMMQTWSYYGWGIDYTKEKKNVFAIDVGTGLVLWNFLDLSYTLRTNFKTASHKLSLGYTYRFK